jgi:hypothetical protein
MWQLLQGLKLGQSPSFAPLGKLNSDMNAYLDAVLKDPNDRLVYPTGVLSLLLEFVLLGFGALIG